MIHFLDKIKHFIIQIFIPLKVIRYHKMSFFLWVMFTLLGGLLGVIVSVIKIVMFDKKYDILQALYIESTNGSFYTYAIAVVAAVLGSVFIIFSENQKLVFRRYQIPLITFSIFLLLFGGVFYALAKNSSPNVGEIPLSGKIVLEYKQFVVFILSIFFSVYSFCVCRLDEHQQDFSEISDDRLKNAEPANDREVTPEINN